MCHVCDVILQSTVIYVLHLITTEMCRKENVCNISKLKEYFIICLLYKFYLQVISTQFGLSVHLNIISLEIIIIYIIIIIINYYYYYYYYLYYYHYY